MKKSILLATLVVVVFVAPALFAQGGKHQGPIEKTTVSAEKKEIKKEQKTADNSMKHHHYKKEKKAS